MCVNSFESTVLNMNCLSILPLLFNLAFSFDCSKEFTCEDYESKFSEILQCQDYDNQIRPKKALNQTGPDVLKRKLVIHKIKDLNQIKGEITIENEHSFWYQDQRLAWPSKCSEESKYYSVTFADFLVSGFGFWFHPMVFTEQLNSNGISLKEGFFGKRDGIDLLLNNVSQEKIWGVRP